jgi:SAM-dependent methyltransferase
MYEVPACLVCGEEQRTIVAEYNRLIAIDGLRDADITRSEYALCHGCGLVYATRRPGRAEYDYMYENFNELLLREDKSQRNIFNLPDELDDTMRDDLDRGYLPWWELRGAPLDADDRVRAPMLREFDRQLADLPHLMPHVSFDGASVLQVRAKTGQFADFMMRALGARMVDVMTLFPAQTYIARKSRNVRAETCIDYETFRIPFEERYDLILENHVLIHMLRPDETFAEFRAHLADGGALFLKNELDDARLFAKGANMFAELRSFHFQQFDIPSLERVLLRFGFAPVAMSHSHPKKSDIVGLARMQDSVPSAAPRIPPAELKARLAMYSQWRDESVLSLPRDLAEALFGGELAAMRARVESTGRMSRDRKGRLPALRTLRFDDRPDGSGGVSALELMAA